MFNRKLKAAQDSSTDYVTLRKMVNSRNVKIREALAANKNLQTYLYPQLAIDVKESVRLALIDNPNLTVEVWETLSKDESEIVRNKLSKIHPEKPSQRHYRS